MKHPIVLWVLMVLLLGCETTTAHRPASLEVGFQDRFFNGYEDVAVESEQDVFAVSPAMAEFIQHYTGRGIAPKQQVRNLVDGIFGHANMNLLYSSKANTIASQTFDQQQANCLSMTIMTYAMARYAGMDVAFQRIDVPEFWERREGYSLLNGHVNLRVFPATDNRNIYFSRSGLEVDFDPSGYGRTFEAKVISKKMVLAMFYNNKAADALLAEDYKTAYAYLKEALTIEPELGEGWANLGVLYRRRSLLSHAEAAYQQALSLGANRTARENLAYLYRITGREEEAQSILAAIERQRLDNPYYHFLLGEVALDEHHPREAVTHYRRAIKLNSQKHSFYFGMARAYAELGEREASRRYLRKAKRHTDYEDEQQRYQKKLNLLSRVTY